MRFTLLEILKRYKVLIGIVLVCVSYGMFVYIRSQKDTSDHYVNSIYKSDERIYKNYLNDDEKKMYDLVLDSTIKHKYNTKIDLNDYHCDSYERCAEILQTVNEAMYVDHPELLSYAGYSWKYSNGQFTVVLIPAYQVSFKDYYGVWRINSKLSKIEKETKGMSDAEKILYVYDWIGDNNTYDYYFMITSKNQSIYNVFLKKNAVCAGFAKTAQVIFARIGIESYIVNGQTDDYHMWNMVKYKDEYFYFDSTVAVVMKKGTEHYYEGLQQEQFGDYLAFHESWYPKLSEGSMFPDIEKVVEKKE